MGNNLQSRSLISRPTMAAWMRVAALLLSLLGLGGMAFSQEQPQSATVCQLKNDPPAYNHKLVEVTAFVSRDFEDFTMFDAACPSWPAVWLEYGAKLKSGTMYCCGETADRHRPEELNVEGIPVPLTENEQFREFDKLIYPPFRPGQHGSIVHATLIGRFFSGRQIKYPKATLWGGYGHMGCCSLLTIEQVKSVTPQDRDDLYYGASPYQPEAANSGCQYTFLVPIQQTSELVKAQQQADLGQRDWMFNDPRQVAAVAVAKFAHVEEHSVADLKQTSAAQGSFVYEWKPRDAAETYIVVVSRPYLLSFYARDSNRVAWVVTAAYLSSCRKRKYASSH